jgi:hypothetical protein
LTRIHPQARTTPLTRTEIKTSQGTVAELARRYNITEATARKWKGRETPADLSHRPHKLSTTMSPGRRGHRCRTAPHAAVAAG